MSTVAENPEAVALPLETPRPVPWGGAIAWLRASQRWRRVVPAPLAMAALDLGHRLAVRRAPSRLDAARAAMAAVVGGTSSEADLDELAFRHLCASSREWEVMWRPWLLDAIPVEGAERLAGLEPGRGIVFSTVHFGPQAAITLLSRVVGPVHIGVGDQLVVPVAAPGYDGYQNEQGRMALVRNGCRVVRALGSARLLTEVLREGGRVLLHFDVPGSQEVRFLGKTAEMTSGTARMAASTDAVVVPVIPLPRDGRWVLHLAEPLDPRDYDGWQDLMQDLATVLGELILRAPEHLESPLRDGGWAVANRDGWRKNR